MSLQAKSIQSLRELRDMYARNGLPLWASAQHDHLRSLAARLIAGPRF